ncbi:hypothetical protein ABC347_15650 [Sphingomonas sp. 1P06PA]
MDEPIRDDKELPELETKVALAGTRHQADVGGSVCFNSVVAIAIYTNRP